MMEHYETIDLENYFQTGEGGTALTYSHKDGKTLAKLFMPGVGADTAAREFSVNRIVYDLGLPTPKPIRLITDGTRFGTEYELIAGKRSFARIISQEPEMLEPLSLRFAELSKQIHRTAADTARLPGMKDLVRKELLRFETMPEDLRKKALAVLDTLPDATTCLHGDLHIGNIITDGKRDLWIDVGDFAYGIPEWDLCLFFYLSHFLDASRTDNLFHLPPDVLRKHWDIFLRAYYGTEDEKELRSREQALHPYVALKVLFSIGKTGNAFKADLEGVFRLAEKYL